MRNWILALFLMVLPFGAMAGSETINFGELSDAEIALIKADIEKRKAEAAGVAGSLATAETIGEYTILGQQVAQAIIGVASELGQEVDEVMGTTTGKLILAIIIYKIAGSELLHYMAGFVWFLFMIPIWWWLMRRFCLNYEEEFHHETGKLIARKRGKVSQESATIFIIAAVVIVLAGLIITFTG